ncbi:hypothetical protein AJ80_07281 [Polytolypa hystricis UAMH7299]|uniref:Ribosomal RNA-processing protein 1 n=1 Tax=Polytolypa hystricis (strain UAMH7299) TaxID=1447883 RepID=A0A2B7XQQ5_POLH7|nr:hypothetical protein AJ80_07281 [Polytolypa hystricis UAMH7299]
MEQTPFLRGLASSDRKTREKALDSLTLFIQSRRDLDIAELLKIWKGLFFCFYHTDRPLTQQALARSLSSTLIPTLPEQTLLPFLRAFWITMSRDFHSLDRLRLDKYLFLFRCYIGAAFDVYLKRGFAAATAKGDKKQKKNNKGKKQDTTSAKKRKRAQGDDGEGQRSGEDAEEKDSQVVSEEWKGLERYLDMLEEGPLCPYNFLGGGAAAGAQEEDEEEDEEEDGLPKESRQSPEMPKGPDGIRYHIIDIWLDEIEKVATETETVAKNDQEDATMAEDDDEDEEEEVTVTKLKQGVPMELLLRPMQLLLERSVNKAVRKRVAEMFDDERLVEWGVRERKKDGEEDEDEEEDEGWGGIDG